MSEDISVLIVGSDEGSFDLVVANSFEAFQKTTVRQLKEKINKVKPVDPEFIRLLFSGKQLEDHKDLKFYNIQEDSTIVLVSRVHGGSDSKRERVPKPALAMTEKEYPSDFSLEFTNDPDCLDPFPPDDDSPKRIKMRCGHAVEPNNLTAYIRNQIDQRCFEFKCPAVVDKVTNKACGKEWEYAEVRLAAMLTNEEMRYIECKMSEYAASQYCEVKECPRCRAFVERRELDNLNVNCPFCTKRTGKRFDFCWQCFKEWTGPTRSSVQCGNPNCIHADMSTIKNAPEVKVCGYDVPNCRACPTCGKVLEHTTQACKNLICPRCKKEFCFLCLELTVDCQKSAPSSWYKACAKGVAPRQTFIPSWSRAS